MALMGLEGKYFVGFFLRLFSKLAKIQYNFHTFHTLACTWTHLNTRYSDQCKLLFFFLTIKNMNLKAHCLYIKSSFYCACAGNISEMKGDKTKDL